MRLAARRYLDDRRRAREAGAPFVFSPEKAVDACAFIEKLPHVEGRWETPNITLHRAHVFFLVNLFGFRNADGTRRFTSALLSIARKNAKSTIAAAILLYCFCCEDEPGPQVISAATTGSQARIVFNIAKRMVEKTPDLREHFGLEAFANAIANYQVGGTFKPINAKASTQDGLNPSHLVLDEIHAHKTHDLLNVLQSAAGARLNALWLYTTTEGYETPGPWPELRMFAEQVLQGLVQADHFFALIFTLDEQEGKPGEPGYREADDDLDEGKWVKANPLSEVNAVLQRELRKASIDARSMPGRRAEFRTKRVNRRSAAANAWLRVDAWKRCGATPVDLAALEGAECYAAIDGAATTDLFAFRLVWRKGDVVYTWGRRWVPEQAVRKRSERGTVPYAGWVQMGLITMLPGEVIDYAAVERDVLELCRRFRPRAVAYDPWGIRDLVNRLGSKLPPGPAGADGKPTPLMQEFRQGPKSYHAAMQETERLYLKGDLAHGNDPVLNWCASNVVPRTDENMNMAPDRKRSADKIDDAAALFMAVGAMMSPLAAAAPKTYQLVII
jgi:phage terminase large subunit-like protein